MSKTTELIEYTKSVGASAYEYALAEQADAELAAMQSANALAKAEQQFTGFHIAYTGGTIETLVIDMGLSLDEWETLKPGMPWLHKRLVEYVDEYFAKQVTK